MAVGAFGAGLLGLLSFAAATFDWLSVTSELGLVAIFLSLNVMLGGARLGRKVYLVDMAGSGSRTAYVAVSNTLIGVLMPAGGMNGLVTHPSRPLRQFWSSRSNRRAASPGPQLPAG